MTRKPRALPDKRRTYNLNKLTSRHYLIGFNHRPVVREIRINRAYELMDDCNENKSFIRQSAMWHQNLDRALSLLELNK